MFMEQIGAAIESELKLRLISLMLLLLGITLNLKKAPNKRLSILAGRSIFLSLLLAMEVLWLSRLQLRLKKNLRN